MAFVNDYYKLVFFGKVSGLRLNNKKTEALWIGSCKGSEEVFFPEKTFNWPKLKVKALGIWFSTDPLITINTNYEEKMKKVKNCLNCWELRRLSLIGKITVLKSLIASQLVYILVTLPTCEPFIREINQIFFDFLWSGRGDKIKRNIMINDYPDGGLKMIDIQSFNKSLKTTWIKKYLDPNNRGKVFLQTQKPGKLAYKKLIQRKSITPKASQEKWLKDCDIPENQPVQWRRVFTCPFKYTKCTKLITFHFKLMHRRIATNTFLNKIGIKDSKKCSFCEDEPEHLLHLFWNCPKTSSFWNNLIAQLSLFNVIEKDFNLNSAVALGLSPVFSKGTGLINLCLLIARFFIWLCKLNQRTPDLSGYLSLLKRYKDLDLQSNKPSSTNRKLWEPLNKWI